MHRNLIIIKQWEKESQSWFLPSLLEDEYYFKVYIPLNSVYCQCLLRFSTFHQVIFDCLFISLKVTSQLLTLFVCMSGFSSRLIISHLHRWYGGGGALRPVRDAFLSVFCLLTPFIVSVFLAVWVCWLSPSLPYHTCFPCEFFKKINFSAGVYQNMATQQTAEPLYKCTSYPLPLPFLHSAPRWPFNP